VLRYQILHLDGRSITDISPGAFHGLHDVRWLFMERNRLRMLGKHSLDGLGPSLKVLALSNNAIADIHPGAFAHLGGLTHLYLERHQLSQLRPGTFEGLAGLQALFMQTGSLAQLDEGALQGPQGLGEFYLAGNPMASIVDCNERKKICDKPNCDFERDSCGWTGSNVTPGSDVVSIDWERSQVISITRMWHDHSTGRGQFMWIKGRLNERVWALTSPPMDSQRPLWFSFWYRRDTAFYARGRVMHSSLMVEFQENGSWPAGGLGAGGNAPSDGPEAEGPANEWPAGRYHEAPAEQDGFWQHATVYLPAGATAVRIVVRIRGYGTVAIDDVEFSRPDNCARHLQALRDGTERLRDLERAQQAGPGCFPCRCSGLPPQRRLETCAAASALGYESLDLSQAGISSINSNAFAGLEGLRRLDLRRNRLTRIERGVFNLPRLQELLLYGNPIATLELCGGWSPDDCSDRLEDLYNFSDFVQSHTEPRCFPCSCSGDAAALRLETCTAGTLLGYTTVDLHRGNITSLAPDAFEGMRELRTLDLRWNRLQYLEPGTFSSLDGLGLLLVSSNRVQELRPGTFEGLSRVTSLYLEENPILGLEPGVFRGLLSLSSLSIGSIMVEELAPGVLSGLPKLKDFWMTETPLRRILPGAFQGMGRMRRVWLRANIMLRRVEPGAFDGLGNATLLNLENCSLQQIEPGTFRNMSKLQELKLPLNQIKELNASMLEGVGTTMWRLNLSSNNISTVASGALDGFPHLRELDVRSNPIVKSMPSCGEGAAWNCAGFLEELYRAGA